MLCNRCTCGSFSGMLKKMIIQWQEPIITVLAMQSGNCIKFQDIILHACIHLIRNKI